MRHFQLDRVKDSTKISGTGLVAEGVEFEDGQVVLRWYNTGSITIFKSLQDCRKVHCAGNHTRIIHDGNGKRLDQLQRENMGHSPITKISSGLAQCQQCHLSKTYWEHFNIACRFSNITNYGASSGDKYKA
jgi:hypothetical protein